MMEELLAAGVHWKIFNFVLFVGVLFFVLRRPVRDFWTSRAHGIRFEMEEAEKIHREAKERHEALERRWAEISAEAATLVRTLKEEGEMERNRIMKDAERLSQRMGEDGEKIASQEIRRARTTLRAQAVRLSVELAERLLRENFNETDQKRITEKYLSDLSREAS